MNTIFNRSTVAGFASVAAAFASSSCSLPPREAWHQIQRDGLIGFLSNQCHAPASTGPTSPALVPADGATATPRTAIASNSEKFVGPPGPAEPLSKTPVPKTASGKAVTPARANVAANIMPVPENPLLATSVPSLPGFVRSPYTTPPRLVDVKGAGPGAAMVCPYTQRVFIIPPDFVGQPAAVAGATPATTTPVPQPPIIAPQNGTPGTPPPATNPPLVASKDNAPSMPPSATNPPAVVSKNTTPGTPSTVTNPTAVAPPNSAPGTPTPPATNPPSVASKNSTPSMPPPATTPPANALFNSKTPNTAPPATNTAAAKSAAPEIPYGIPIPNRPGYVNSPFAAKHQLVDVSGLPVGMEVKCPYTGKLFRVPAMDIAEQKAVAAPGAPPAPDKAEKK